MRRARVHISFSEVTRIFEISNLNFPMASTNPIPHNGWYHITDSNIAVVFVHGILSDSTACWRYRNRKDTTKSQFWPDLVAHDITFENSSVFLGGYYSKMDGGPYGIEHAAQGLFRSLKYNHKAGGALLAKRHLLFVCHSTGGILVRYMLNKNIDAFKDKTVGLLLVASPSLGALDAVRLRWFSRVYKNRMASQLKWKGEFLMMLHEEFKSLLYHRKLPHLVGTELVEHHFLLHYKLLPPLRPVVDVWSAGVYFPSATIIPGTNHSSIVKPYGEDHPSHQELELFFAEQFKAAMATNLGSPAVVPAPADVVLPALVQTGSLTREPRVLRVVIAVVVKESHVLLVERRDAEGQLRWTFPTGILKPNRDASQTARDTVEEETGVRCKVVNKLGQ